MYERHWRLRHAPFGRDGRAESFFVGSSHQSALLKLRFLIDHQRGAGLLVGPSGSGKTRLLDLLLRQSGAEATPVVRIVYPLMSPIELLRYISSALGSERMTTNSTPMDVVLKTLEDQLRTLTASGRPPVIVIDDAHAIADRHVLHSLPLLLNFQQPQQLDFTLILSGQPELAGMVKRLPQLDDRIALSCVLMTLSAAETAAYVRHHLQAAGATEPIFTEAALKVIHELSGGLPRRINRLCDFALLVGYAEGLAAIDADHVEGVSAELHLSPAA